MKSEVHSTALCKRITNCNFSCDVVAAPDTNGQSGSQFFSHATLVETKFATQWGEKCCWHAIFTQINKSVDTKKKYEAHSGQWGIPAMSRQPPAQQAKSKKRSGCKRGAYLCFCAAARWRHEIDPHGLRRKPKMPKIINLGNCVKLLWFTTFWKKVLNLVAFLGSSFEIWTRP